MVLPKPTKQLSDVSHGRPHIVLLGAGASRAAFPNGDRNGKQIPIMNDLIKIVGLDLILSKHGISYSINNFEEIYSNILKDSTKADIALELEKQVFDYFSSLELPDEPTIYDHLVLSLREKDVIATFNWDPFLQQALNRNYNAVPVASHVFYLHGNVAIGYCTKCKRRKGPIRSICNECQSGYKPSKLLYPIDKKNYQQEFIDMEWAALAHYMKNAYIFTVFGYGAPKSDVEAVDLLKNAWGGWEERNMEQFEFIHRPGKKREDVIESWDDFIHTHHYEATGDFFESILGRHPRRSCESIWNTMMMCNPPLDNLAPRKVSLIELQDWYKKLVELE